LKEAELTIRVPYLPAAKRIDFFELATSTGGSSAAQKRARITLGSICLPLNPQPSK
jgi:hypothetical protein